MRLAGGRRQWTSPDGAPRAWQFSVDVARAWESAFDSARTPRTRKVKLRTAVVMGLQALSNTVSVPWALSPTPGGGTAPAPAITSPSPADGTAVTKPVPISATFSAPAGQTITSWSVTYHAVSQGPVVTLATATGPPPNPPKPWRRATGPAGGVVVAPRRSQPTLCKPGWLFADSSRTVLPPMSTTFKLIFSAFFVSE